MLVSRHYLTLAVIEIYIYFTSPYPLYILMKKISLANRKIRVLLSDKKNKGRPAVNAETIKLILELKKSNPTWGGQKISDELKKIGHKVSKKSVLKYLEIYGMSNPPPDRGMSWSDFLSNHKFKISIDFTSVITLAGDQLFILVMINLDTRELLWVNSTYSPHSEWIKQQFKNAFFDLDEYPTLCISDRDTIFGPWFKKAMKELFHIKLIYTPFKSPQYNGRCERFHRTLKEEALANIIAITPEQINRVCSKYQKYYNTHRPHQGLEGKIPTFSESFPKNVVDFSTKKHLHNAISSFEPVKIAA